MKRTIILLATLLYALSLKAQIFGQVCSNSTNTSSLKSVSVSDLFDITNEPIKTVRINLIFLRKDDGSCGFQQNNTDDQQYIEDMINDMNNCYSTISNDYNTQCYNGYYGVTYDSKIRFDVNTIYLNNSTAWDNHNKSICPDESNYHLQSLNNQIAQNSTVPRLNIFFTEDSVDFNNIIINQNCPIEDNYNVSSTCCSLFPSSYNFNLDQSIQMRNMLIKYYWMMHCVVNNNMNDPDYASDPPTEDEAYSWLRQGRCLAHELGHSLDLVHTNPNTCTCSKHLMMNQGCGYDNFLSPTEIASMHDALSLGSVRRYVTETTYSSTPYPITTATTWNSNMRIYRGITHSQNTFSLSNNLIIPSETDFIVTGTANLNMSGATISTPHTNSVLDLKMNSNSTGTITNSTISNCNVEITGSSSVTVNNSTFNIGDGGSFKVNVGATFVMNQGTIQ